MTMWKQKKKKSAKENQNEILTMIELMEMCLNMQFCVNGIESRITWLNLEHALNWELDTNCDPNRVAVIELLFNNYRLTDFCFRFHCDLRAYWPDVNVYLSHGIGIVTWIWIRLLIFEDLKSVLGKFTNRFFQTFRCLACGWINFNLWEIEMEFVIRIHTQMPISHLIQLLQFKLFFRTKN